MGEFGKHLLNQVVMVDITSDMDVIYPLISVRVLRETVNRILISIGSLYL